MGINFKNGPYPTYTYRSDTTYIQDIWLYWKMDYIQQIHTQGASGGVMVSKLD